MIDISLVVKLMTLEEKAAMCTGTGLWTTLAVEQLGVPRMIVADGPHGVRRVPDAGATPGGSLPATCFPTAACLASTWDLDLVREVGRAIGQECIALNVDVLLGPGNNIKRTPLCGRNFEYYSEDPFLSGEMAAGFIDGVQSMGVGTSLKHFAANNQEFQRFSIDVAVDERTLREIYLAGFEAAVKKARPWTVMCAYNKINGAYCSESHQLLGDILRSEWGFEGLVISDWGAVHDRVAALTGGLDLEMPGPRDYRVRAVVDAVRSGALDEAVLDESVRRLLDVVFKAAETPKGGELDVEAHHALARKVAAEGMVLLKNDGVLPLRNPRRIAVIGRAARSPLFQGGGSSRVNPTRVAIPFDEIEHQAGGAALTYAEGCPADTEFRQALIDEAVAAARAADVALLFIAHPSYWEFEGYDRPGLDLTRQQVTLIKAVAGAQPRTVVILNTGSAVAMAEWIDAAAAVVEAWLMGQAGGGAVADVLFGRVNPSGRLAETFPLRLADTPAHINYPGENGQVRYGEGLFVGYRYYDAREMPVLFPFGHGLSYTTFAYSSPRVSATTFSCPRGTQNRTGESTDDTEVTDRDGKAVDGVTVSVDVTNTGTIAGKEVVQVYVHDRASGLVRPPKELKGFAKVELQPGETRTVSIPLDFRSFAYYHPGYRQWIVEDGEFDILIGASAADIRCTVTVSLQSAPALPCVLTRESTIRAWLSDPRGRAVAGPTIRRLMVHLGKPFDASEAIDEADRLELMGLLEMPLRSLLQYDESVLPMTADELVDDLLRQVHGAPG